MMQPGVTALASDTDVRPSDKWLGDTLRQLRKSRAMSIKTLGEKANVSNGMISQIERGVTSPSIRSLLALSHALDVPPSRFFQDQTTDTQDHSGVVIRPHERQQLKLAENGVVQELMTSKNNRMLQFVLVRIDPGGSSGPDPYTHKGADAGLILSGKLDLWVDGKHYSLVEGDSFQFSSELPHRYQNNSDVLTTALWITSPSVY
jgi:transcriptional regulator with XRE-family HTH domain